MFLCYFHLLVPLYLHFITSSSLKHSSFTLLRSFGVISLSKALCHKRLVLVKSSLTRAPRGTDRSPEYNEHFCYKLDSRVKNYTTEWNQKQQHFITHTSRSLLWIQFVAVAFQSEEKVRWTRGPPVTYLPRPESAPGRIWQKNNNNCNGP